MANFKFYRNPALVRIPGWVAGKLRQHSGRASFLSISLSASPPETGSGA